MSAVSEVLLETIHKLQNLPALQEAVLGGGTSLALRYDHRESVDIDLIFSRIMGRDHYREIESQVRDLYNEAIIGLDYPCDIDDQYMFLRFYVRKGGEQIKVEILQNMSLMDEPEIISDVRAVSESDIGMLKLVTASNRCSFKDIYDLHYITENLPLAEIFHRLEDKQKTCSGEECKTIFDLDGEVSPVDDPKLLLEFDAESKPREGRPSHSTHHFTIVNGITWQGAKAAWRRKVRELLKELGIEFPKSL